MAMTGCEKNRGEAVVLSKEHIDARPPTAETSNAQSRSGPDAEIRPMADDEIAVDGYVMFIGCSLMGAAGFFGGEMLLGH